MQLWGDTDGSYYTAHWTYYKVSKYPAMSSNAIWTFDTNEEVVGGVTADEDFVYAMHYTEPKVWKLNKETGALVETITLPSMAGTLYGGLAMVGDTLYVGRHHGVVYRVDMSDRTIIDSFRLGTNIYNMSYDGTDYCISANTDLIHCHNVCDDALQPSAESIQASTVVNTPLGVTLEGSDPNDEPLTYTVLDVPEHGTLTGVAPNLTYTALTDFVGFDNFTYRVNNGSRNSTVARVTISILPDLPEQPECQLVDPPTYVGAPAVMDTKSYGGGYSPAYQEYWYPQWSGVTIHRYNKGREYIGSFNTGLANVMQLWGMDDGTYLTAHWGLKKVSRWQGLSANLVWSTELPVDYVGGVTAGPDFVYAMGHTGSTVYKLNPEDGSLEGTFTVEGVSGTNYGALTYVGGLLYIGNHNGDVIRYNVANETVVGTFSTESVIRNTSFDGTDYCISPNSSFVYCYSACQDSTRPTALSQNLSVQTNDSLDITLEGNDPENRDLTYTIVTQPGHGTLTGTVPELTYEPIGNFTGFDAFSFKVNNGIKDSPVVQIDITILPDTGPVGVCDPTEAPTYVGSPVTMNTRSHGGGFSPAFGEYWYPAWGGTTVYRYNKDFQPVGTFTTGRGLVMQLWGETDGSYYTANWTHNKVSKWPAMSSNAIWTTDTDGIVGGVTADKDFVYAMDYRAPTLWKMNKQNGTIIETIELPTMTGTLYGGLAIVDGLLYVGRHDGNLYKIDLEERTIVSQTTTSALIYNTSFNGQDYCISPNSSDMFCYSLCNDPTEPTAHIGHISVARNTNTNITLTGEDPQDRDLTYTVVTRPAHGTLSGTAPNLVYSPIFNFVGADAFSFKVNNGLKDSPVVQVNITVLPNIPQPLDCTRIDPPTYRGSPITMDTKSYGGGFSPAFGEYWYPEWSGRTITRYDKEHRQIGTFTTGHSQVMQLWGDTDGSYYTAHWSLKKVGRWQGLSDIALWVTSTDDVVGGVTADENFVYAMAHAAPTLWKFNKETGALLATEELESMSGTLYGGLALVDGILYIARSTGTVYRYNMGTEEMSSFGVSTTVQNTSFNGTDICYSPNSDKMFCHTLCDDPDQPSANGRQFSTQANTPVSITLTGEDRQDRALTFTVTVQPEHGALTGTAPNLTYTPVGNFTGIDSFSFKVNNGTKDSPAVSVGVSVLPEVEDLSVCPEGNRVDPPAYTGSPVTMETRSHGGGYSPGFDEYWYPHWSGRTIYRYDKNRRQIGTFLTGRDRVMQLWGLSDGTYLTAHWTHQSVSRWQAMSADALWTTNLDEVIGGVTASDTHVYAMAHSAAKVYKLDMTTGQLIETIAVPSTGSTLYGGLAYINGLLHVGRSDGRVYRMDLHDGDGDNDAPEIVSTFALDTNIYNMSFNGREFCASPNSDTNYCYTTCRDPARPTASGQQITTRVNTGATITLQGTDPNNQPLTYTVTQRPEHGTLTGTGANLTYTPILDFVGTDQLIFKVNNGTKDSLAVNVNIAILPDIDQPVACQLAADPVYRGRAVTMNTRSHGGGYSPGFGEYWYPNWSGTTISRYSLERDFKGIFTTGGNKVMQLWGEPDGTYYTANWDNQKVSKWQGLSDNLIWSVNLGATVGGVTADADFVYAMAHQGTTAWKLDKDSGEVIEQFTVPSMPGTLYGGLAALDGDLLVGRDDRKLYRIDLGTGTIVKVSSLAVRAYNMNFNGVDYCVSENNSDVHCYAVCSNSANRAPFIETIADQAHSEGVSITLGVQAFDDDNNPLTFSASNLPSGLSINPATGVISGQIADGEQPNSPYSVVITVSDGLVSTNASFDWTVFDPDLPAPVFVSRTPESGWTNETPFTVEAHVTDTICTKRPIVFVQGRNLGTSTSDNQTAGWNIETDEVEGADVIHNFSIRVRSLCSDKTTASNVLVGIDQIDPTLNFPSGAGDFDQDGVDQNDPNTWPTLEESDLVSMLVLARDDKSGVAVGRATILPFDYDGNDLTPLNDKIVSIYDETFALVSQTPPTGPLIKSGGWCNNVGYCQGSSLRVPVLEGRFFELRLSLADKAGNAVEQVYRFRTIDLPTAIEQWKDAIDNATTNSAPAQSRLEDASELLDLALLGYAEGHYGNMFLGLEDAAGKVAEARLFDGDLDFQTEDILVSTLATEWLDLQKRLKLEENDENEFFDRVDIFLAQARANIALETPNSARAAFLDLANAFFFYEEAHSTQSATNYATCVPVMARILQSMDDYIENQPELPGSEPISEARVELTEVMEYLQLVVEEGDLTRSDLEHAEALMILTDAAETLKTSENTTAWIRQYQWGLTQIVYIYAERGITNAATFFGGNHPVIALGREQLEAADEFRQDFRADNFMDLLIDSRCMTIGIYNMTYEPDLDVPDACCELIEDYNELEPLIPVPDTCR